jgi:AcrR family transcriptional regulator
MPKFSETELAAIRESMLQKGRELFVAHGLKKTSIDDIVLACGIAKGSFYRFFASKEELYFEIMKQEEAHKIRLLCEIAEVDLPAKERVSRLFASSLEFYLQNDFFRSMHERKDIIQLLRKIPREQLEEHIDSYHEQFLPIIMAWQENGVVTDEDPNVIIALYRAVMLLTYHTEEIGQKAFPRVVELLVDSISDKLTSGHG